MRRLNQFAARRWQDTPRVGELRRDGRQHVGLCLPDCLRMPGNGDHRPGAGRLLVRIGRPYPGDGRHAQEHLAAIGRGQLHEVCAALRHGPSKVRDRPTT